MYYLPIVLRVDHLTELRAREHEREDVFETVQVAEDGALRIVAAREQVADAIVDTRVRTGRADRVAHVADVIDLHVHVRIEFCCGLSFYSNQVLADTLKT